MSWGQSAPERKPAGKTGGGYTRKMEKEETKVCYIQV